MKRRIKVGALVSLFSLGLSAIPLYANVMLPFGPESVGGVPAYARIERLSNGDVLVHNDGEWAAITFYRDVLPLDAGAARRCGSDNPTARRRRAWQPSSAKKRAAIFLGSRPLRRRNSVLTRP